MFESRKWRGFEPHRDHLFFLHPHLLYYCHTYFIYNILQGACARALVLTKDPPRTKDLSHMRVIAGLLFNAEGQVLVALRPAHKPYGNMWEIPGGKLEDKEGYRKALCRELYEELGIVVEPRHLRRIVSQSLGPTEHVYAIRTWQGGLKL